MAFRKTNLEASKDLDRALSNLGRAFSKTAPGKLFLWMASKPIAIAASSVLLLAFVFYDFYMNISMHLS